MIMDGNGRWARARGLERIEGHRQGAATVRLISEECGRLGIDQLTLYCLSSENWKRPREELDFLMRLLSVYLEQEQERLIKNNFRFSVIGERENLPKPIQDQISLTEKKCASHTGTRLCLAINYGSRMEIVSAAKRLIEEVVSGELTIDDVDQDTFSNRLYTAGMPDPDLLIRTSGEMRISNYLLWQISYSEIWVTEKFWPDFQVSDLHQAIHDFSKRDRRFGGLTSEGPQPC